MKTCLHIFLIAFLLSLVPAPLFHAHAADDNMTPATAKKKKKKEKASESQATRSPLDLKLIMVDKVKDVRPTGQIVLANGKTILLDDIRIPVPLQETAVAKLKLLFKDVQIGIYVPPTTPVNVYTDKIGNIIGHVMTEKRAWVQSLLVSNGLAWVDPSANKTNLTYALNRYEERAMQLRNGMWNMPEFSIKNISDIKNYIGSYQIFEGVVVGCSYENPTYISFGRNKGDFMALLMPDLEHELVEKTGLTDRDMIGQKVRIRGWVEDKNGPAIILRQADQMEIIHQFLPTLTPKKAERQPRGSAGE